MKRFTLIIFTCFCLYLSLVANNHYGFRLQGRSNVGESSTTLLLNDKKPFALNNDLIIGLKLEVREGPVDGCIMYMRSGTGKIIEVSFGKTDKDTTPMLQITINGQTYTFPYSLDWDKSEHTLNVKLDKEHNAVSLVYDQNSMTVDAGLNDYSDVIISLGAPEEYPYVNVASVNVSDVHILLDSVSRFFWELKQHKGDVSYDAIQKAPATALNPHWVIDEHHSWLCIYTRKNKENVQITFNPKNNIFYFVTNRNVTLFYPETKKQEQLNINEGYRANIYSNTLVYDTISQQLVSYSLEDKVVSYFDFQTCRWSLRTENKKETSYFNHAWAQNDSIGYAFGGYGFYTFFNSLFKINLKTGVVDKCSYSPEIRQRTCASAAIVGNELYIYGGRGQTVDDAKCSDSHYYYDMYAIELNTMKSRKIWEMADRPKHNFIPASNMYYIPQDTAFYVAGEQHLLKVSMNRPEWTELTSLMPAPKGPYKDMVYNLYYAPKFKRMYLLVNKRINDQDFEVVIYTVHLPLTGLPTVENETVKSEKRIPLPVIIGIVLLLVVIFIYVGRRIYLRKKKTEMENDGKKNICEMPVQQSMVDDIPIPVWTEISFDNKANIHLMGKFKITDQKGNDVTSSFTSRMRSLFLIFLMYHETKQASIQIEKVDECIWSDKDVESARNNRNVYMRKLRLELNKIGDLEIVNNKGFFQLNLGTNVYVDYFELIRNITNIEQGEWENIGLIKRTLQLMQRGTLLPELNEEWLDSFKAETTARVINLLDELLSRSAISMDTSLSIQIAETMFMYDSLNEEALTAKCCLLSKIGKKGMAKNTYENFCREYKRMLGTDYPTSFTDICER